VLILQYLTVRHKLAAISRLSRVFYPLPALAFQYDSVQVTALTVSVLSASDVIPWLELVFARYRSLHILEIAQPTFLFSSREPPVELPTESLPAEHLLPRLTSLM
jgi:hypothetical protein